MIPIRPYLGVLLVLCLPIIGCAKRDSVPPPVKAGEADGEPIPDQWLGQWQGPEGTFLLLTGGDGQYEITIRNLDGPSRYVGVAVDDRIEFERYGVKESIRATPGADTGMKWLNDKTDCLTIHAGEGYCRD